jgi:hypothetical protein
MPEIFNCVLWEKAKVKATERGLEMTPLCPLEGRCVEVKCAIIEASKSDEKLKALREELKTMTDNKDRIIGCW